MTSWTDAGFGLDPEGDAARRADLAPARLVYTTATPTGSALENVERAIALVTGGPATEVEPVEGHEVEYGTTGSVGWARCSCGQWDAAVTGPNAARWAREQFDDHLAFLARAGHLPPG